MESLLHNLNMLKQKIKNHPSLKLDRETNEEIEDFTIEFENSINV